MKKHTVTAYDLPTAFTLLCFFNCFFEVWWHYFDFVWFIFKRGSWSGEGKSYTVTVSVFTEDFTLSFQKLASECRVFSVKWLIYMT